MVRERGYTGGPDHFRHPIAMQRPRPQPEAYLRLKTLPGEQAQVDWAHFGKSPSGVPPAP
jgi:transposase